MQTVIFAGLFSAEISVDFNEEIPYNKKKIQIVGARNGYGKKKRKFR